MAVTIVATQSNSAEVPRGREPDPYERLHTRLAGLRAITVLANVAVEKGDVTEQVWEPLWCFVGELCDDLQLDADELRLQRRRQEVSNG